MANEITALTGDGGNNYTLLFLYPVATPIQVSGNNVVPTPSANLPAEAATILTAQEKTDLDAGTLAFELVTISAQPGLTGGQLATRARTIYASKKAEYTTKYARVYKYYGTRLDEV